MSTARQAEVVARILRGLRSEPSALELARALNDAYAEGLIEAQDAELHRQREIRGQLGALFRRQGG